MPALTCTPAVERCLDGSRLTLPRGCREVFGDTAAVTADLVGCILVTPPALWDELLPSLREQSQVSHHAEQLFRFLSASEASVPVDERGRIVIPRLHLEWAGMSPNKAVVVVALGRMAEIWEPRRLSMHLTLARRKLRDLDSHLFREQLNLLEA